MKRDCGKQGCIYISTMQQTFPEQRCIYCGRLFQ